MKLAQINLARGTYIPGHGSTVKLENMECETQAAGILVTTATAKVLIPWHQVESVVTEWIQATKAVRDAIVGGGVSAVAGTRAEATVFEPSHAPGIGEQLAAATQAGAPVPQPPPPQKKGGRK